jgi:hypothetical protein
MRARLIFAVLLLLALALSAIFSRDAGAYPQFQYTTGNVRCNQCHYAPAGGGLINGWGREESAETLATFGGNGELLHGKASLPPWLGLGADLRAATTVTTGEGGSGEPHVFPMQADLYVRAGHGAWSVYAAAGLKGAVRAESEGAASWIASREHYVMWRKRAVGPYARAGRFYAPHGLRPVEHPLFVRRWLGFGAFEETYGISAGWVGDRGEAHATGFVPDPWRAVGDQGSGGALTGELRFAAAGDAALGAQARLSVADEGTRLSGGALAKWHPRGTRLLFAAEGDLVRETFAGLPGEERLQLAALVAASWFPARGVLIDLYLERFVEDLAVSGVERDAVWLQAHWFPIAHLEAVAFVRAQLLGVGDGPETVTAFFQLHYWL